MGVSVPVIELADDADGGGVGSPDGEVHAFLTVDFADMCTEFFVTFPVCSFAEQMEIKFGKEKTGRKLR
jgi:hypothetical protein